MSYYFIFVNLSYNGHYDKEDKSIPTKANANIKAYIAQKNANT